MDVVLGVAEVVGAGVGDVGYLNAASTIASIIVSLSAF